MKIKYLFALGTLLLAIVCSATFTLPKMLPKNDCQLGFVWREAVAYDYMCVTPEERAAANLQNRKSQENRNPIGVAYGYDACNQGFVWREIYKNDRVCVTTAERDISSVQNKLHCERSHINCRKGK